jgi:Cu/Ag efflux protein CusF
MRKIVKSLALAFVISAIVLPPVVRPASAQQLAALSTQDWYQRIESTRKKAQGRPWVSAIIKKIDVGLGELTISHGAIAHAKMPAMTMTFPVRDPSDLTAHETGDHVQIQVADDGGVIKIVHVKSGKRR